MSTQTVGIRVLAIALTTLLVSAAVVWGTQRAEDVDIQTVGTLHAPATAGDWVRSDGPALWSARHQPTEFSIEARYTRGDEDVQLFAALFPRQRQGNEAINQDNTISTDLLRSTNLGARRVMLGDDEVIINRSKAIVVRDGVQHQHLVWQWYRVAGHNLTNRYQGKAWEALARIYPGRADGAWIALTTPLEDQQLQAADERLADFARGVAPPLGGAIDDVLGLGD